jgi:predicted transcriptional regulator
MPEAKRFELDEPPPVMEEADQATLAAIEEGIRDAEAGRLVSSEEVRKMLPKWINNTTD